MEQGLWPHYYVLVMSSNAPFTVAELAKMQPGWFCSLGVGAA